MINARVYLGEVFDVGVCITLSAHWVWTWRVMSPGAHGFGWRRGSFADGELARLPGGWPSHSKSHPCHGGFSKPLPEGPTVQDTFLESCSLLQVRDIFHERFRSSWNKWLFGPYWEICSVMSNSLQPHGPQPAKVLLCHGLLQAGIPEWVAFAFSVGLYLMVDGKETGCVWLAESHPLPRVGLRWQRRLVHGACHCCKWKCVWLVATPWTIIAVQAPLFLGFPRQEHRSACPFACPGDLPHPGIEPQSPALTGGLFTVWACREASSSSWRPCPHSTDENSETQRGSVASPRCAPGQWFHTRSSWPLLVAPPRGGFLLSQTEQWKCLGVSP